MSKDGDTVENGAVLGPGSFRADADFAGSRQFVHEMREIGRQDGADRAAADVLLRNVSGEEFASGVRVVNGYLDQLPPAERERIENTTMPDGTRALNDPQTVLRLYGTAIGPLPRTPSAVAREIKELETRMRDDRSAWFKDEVAQARYRILQRGSEEE